jgi:hypothetical protein
MVAKLGSSVLSAAVGIDDFFSNNGKPAISQVNLFISEPMKYSNFMRPAQWLGVRTAQREQGWRGKLRPIPVP